MTHLLASLGSKGKNRKSLACLRNAGSHSAVTYCNYLLAIFITNMQYLLRIWNSPPNNIGVVLFY